MCAHLSVGLMLLPLEMLRVQSKEKTFEYCVCEN